MQTPLRAPALQRRIFSYFGVLVALAALGVLVMHIPRTTAVFIIGAFIAFGVSPIVGRLARHMPRAAAIATVYLGIIAIATVVLLLIVPAAVTQIEVIATNAPSYIGIVQHWLDGTQALMQHTVAKQYLPAGATNLRGFVSDKVSALVTSTLASFASILIGTLTAFVVGITSIVLSLFFVWRGDRVADGLYQLLPESRRGTAHLIGIEIAHVFGGYISGQLIVCGLVGVIVFPLLLLTGFKFALLVAFVTGLAYAVPFAGLLIAHLLGFVLALPQGGTTVIWVQVILFVIGRAADNVIVPRVMSGSVGVSPIVVIFSTFAGGELFGIPGLLLGIPIAAAVKVAWRFYRARPVEAQVAEYVAEHGELAAIEIVVEPVVI